MASSGSLFSSKWFSKLYTFGTSWSVGDARHSFLTETQFQSVNGDTWVLCDGRDVTGSQYHTITGNTTVPDARGQFLRGINNGRADGQQDPDGERSPGHHQTDRVGEHYHTHPHLRINGAGGGYGAVLDFDNPNNPVNTDAFNVGLDSRPRNVACNIFIKIN